MMYRFIILFVLFLSPILAFAEGQYVIGKALNLIHLGIVMLLTILLSLIVYFLLRRKNSRIREKRYTLIFFACSMLAGISMWQITKHNPSRLIQDYQEENSDWTISYNYSNPQGVYYYLDGERIFLRELTEDEADNSAINGWLTKPLIDSIKASKNEE